MDYTGALFIVIGKRKEVLIWWNNINSTTKRSDFCFSLSLKADICFVPISPACSDFPRVFRFPPFDSINFIKIIERENGQCSKLMDLLLYISQFSYCISDHYSISSLSWTQFNHPCICPPINRPAPIQHIHHLSINTHTHSSTTNPSLKFLHIHYSSIMMMVGFAPL